MNKQDFDESLAGLKRLIANVKGRRQQTKETKEGLLEAAKARLEQVEEALDKAADAADSPEAPDRFAEGVYANLATERIRLQRMITRWEEGE